MWEELNAKCEHCGNEFIPDTKKYTDEFFNKDTGEMVVYFKCPECKKDTGVVIQTKKGVKV